jgi:hypothetical protein
MYFWLHQRGVSTYTPQGRMNALLAEFAAITDESLGSGVAGRTED